MNTPPLPTRRTFLTALGTLAAAPLLARDFGPGAPPVRYPEPDVRVLEPRFKARSAARPSRGCTPGCCGRKGRRGAARAAI